MALIDVERSGGVEILTPRETYQRVEQDLSEDPRYLMAQTMNFGDCKSSDEFIRILQFLKYEEKIKRELRIDGAMVNRPYPEAVFGLPVSKDFSRSFDPKDLRAEFRPYIEAIYDSNTDLLLTNPPNLWQGYVPFVARGARAAA